MFAKIEKKENLTKIVPNHEQMSYINKYLKGN